MARPARTGIQTAPGRGPSLETITRANGFEIPLVTDIAVGTWGYRAGQAGEIVIPEDARLLSFTATAGVTGATVRINDGDTIAIPATMGFGVDMNADVFNAKLTFTGTESYFVQYIMEGQA